MKSPHKIRRIQRQFQQGTSAEPINIVSLIDIFAILVFYLLVSIAAVEMHPNEQAVQLPRSTSPDRPHETTQLMVTRKDILLNNHFVMSTEEALASNDKFLPKLKSEFLSGVGLQQSADTGSVNRGEINILANKDIPYALLKRLMATCSEAQFTRISLAVVQRPEEKQ
jgi:biopolymer transport protein ExbD